MHPQHSAEQMTDLGKSKLSSLSSTQSVMIEPPPDPLVPSDELFGEVLLVMIGHSSLTLPVNSLPWIVKDTVDRKEKKEKNGW